jgi:hypothetical protein
MDGVSGAVAIGFSRTGSLQKQLPVPLWDGNRPDFVSKEFMLQETGHFWLHTEIGFDVLKMFGFSDIQLGVMITGDILTNVDPPKKSQQTRWIVLDHSEPYTLVKTLADGKDVNAKGSSWIHFYPGTIVKALRNGAYLVRFAKLRVSVEKGEKTEVYDGDGDRFTIDAQMHDYTKDCPGAPNSFECVIVQARDIKEHNLLALVQATTLKACQDTCDEYMDTCRFVSYGEKERSCALLRTANVDKQKSLGTVSLFGKYTDSIFGSNSKMVKNAAADPEYLHQTRSGAVEPWSRCEAERSCSSDQANEDIKKLAMSSYTMSFFAQIVLTLDLRKYTFGLISAKLAAQAALAIRKGDVMHDGVYLTLQLSASNQGHLDLMGQMTEKTDKLVHGVNEMASEQIENIGVDELNKLGARDKKDAEKQLNLGSPTSVTAEANARLQVYFHDSNNFGFRLKLVACYKKECKVSVQETIRKDDSVKVCSSSVSTAQHNVLAINYCTSSFLQMMIGKAGEAILAIAEGVGKDIGKAAVVVGKFVGKLTDGFLNLGRMLISGLQNILAQLPDWVKNGLRAAADAAAQFFEMITFGMFAGNRDVPVFGECNSHDECQTNLCAQVCLAPSQIALWANSVKQCPERMTGVCATSVHVGNPVLNTGFGLLNADWVAGMPNYYDGCERDGVCSGCNFDGQCLSNMCDLKLHRCIECKPPAYTGDNQGCKSGSFCVAGVCEFIIDSYEKCEVRANAIGATLQPQDKTKQDKTYGCYYYPKVESGDESKAYFVQGTPTEMAAKVISTHATKTRMEVGLWKESAPAEVKDGCHVTLFRGEHCVGTAMGTIKEMDDWNSGLQEVPLDYGVGSGVQSISMSKHCMYLDVWDVEKLPVFQEYTWRQAAYAKAPDSSAFCISSNPRKTVAAAERGSSSTTRYEEENLPADFVDSVRKLTVQARLPCEIPADCDVLRGSNTCENKFCRRKSHSELQQEIAKSCFVTLNGGAGTPVWIQKFDGARQGSSFTILLL